MNQGDNENNKRVFHFSAHRCPEVFVPGLRRPIPSRFATPNEIAQWLQAHHMTGSRNLNMDQDSLDFSLGSSVTEMSQEIQEQSEDPFAIDLGVDLDELDRLEAGNYEMEVFTKKY